MEFLSMEFLFIVFLFIVFIGLRFIRLLYHCFSLLSDQIDAALPFELCVE